MRFTEQLARIGVLSLICSIFLGICACSSAGALAGRTGQDKVLVFTYCKGYKHSSIPYGAKAIREMGLKNNFAVDTTRNPALFTLDYLKHYKAVVFLSTTGDILNPEQQTAFEQYIRSGGGYVGIHAAADCEYKWPWYGQLVGAYFAGHPRNQTATINVVDKTHLSSTFLPDQWERFDEWYSYRAIQPHIRVVAKLDETTYEGGKNGDNHPIAWYHAFDGGRAFYTGGGHTQESFSEPLFLDHLLGGIKYAIGGKTAKSKIRQ